MAVAKSEWFNFMKSAKHSIMKHLKGNKLKESVRDRRIIFERNGKFDKYITSVVAKGNCMVGWILRTFTTRTNAHNIKNIKYATSRIWVYHPDANFSKLSELN